MPFHNFLFEVSQKHLPKKAKMKYSFLELIIILETARLKSRSQVRSQVTGHRSGHRSQATGQVTGHTKNNRTLDKTVLD